MVKFSKELEAQLIPEWKEAFVNYWQLKKQVKKVQVSKIPKTQNQNQNQNFGIFHHISFTSCNFFSSHEKTELIQVKKRRIENVNEEIYQTELSHLFYEEDEVKVFFQKLDTELNKVNQFYKTKEKELLERGEILKKQLEVLKSLKQIINGPQLKNSNSLSQHDSSISSNFCESCEELSEITSEADDVTATLEKNDVNFANLTKNKNISKKSKSSFQIEIPTTNPTRTISAITSMLWEDLVNSSKKEGQKDYINRKKFHYAQKMIRNAFVELYKGLSLLRKYSSLNWIAFQKILKKFDKVSNQQASISYLNAVKKSHFISSDKGVRLMEEVESIFTKHFANDNRKKAMQYLRPPQNKESHMVTFFVGLFTGGFLSLFSVYLILVRISGIFTSPGEIDYMETVYPVFSIIALLSLHLFMYGCNLFAWNATRINYNFIFEFSANTALRYRDAFLLATTFMTCVFGAMVVHLLLRGTDIPASTIDTIPGVFLLVFICLLICPLDIFYRPTRYSFLRILRNIVFSPFYKVLMVDFFMADQLTSQIPVFRYLESTACYFIAENFKTHEYDICRNGKLYRELAYVVSFAPYYWRAMQCARRWFDEDDMNHLANMGKYVSAMVAAGVRITYARESNTLWFVIVLVTSVFATIYQLYWDFVKDWGVLNLKSKNPLLRDDLILKKRYIYYLSMSLNVALRVAWVETVIRYPNISNVESHLLDFFLASLEVIRRGHWNFYRLENEHLNNVGKFRAVKSVPLPFREIDFED